MTTSNNAIKTARRIFEVLEYFEQVRRPASLKEISTKFGYPGSSASALLKSMVTLGYLFYHSDTRTYMPTMRIAEIGRWLESTLFGESSIMALVEYVHERTDELTSISTRSDLVAQYLHTIQTSQRLRFEVHPGDLRPLTASGIGRTVLSMHTDDEIDRLVRRINATQPPEQQTKLETLMPIINKIRRDGYYHSRHIVTPEAAVIAMPLPKRNYGRILVLGVGGPVSRMDSKEAYVLDVMREGIQKFVTDDN